MPRYTVEHKKQLGSSKSRILLGKSAEEFVLLLDGLEATVAVLRGGIDELDVEWLVVRALDDGNERLTESDASLSGPGHASLDHQPVLVHLAVVREASHGSDALLGQIRLGRGRASVTLLADAKHALVDLSSVVVTLLTRACDSGLDAGRVPGADTGNLAQSSVGLAGKSGDSPSSHNTREPVTARCSADIKSLALRENGSHGNLLLEEVLRVLHLGGDVGASVYLNLQKIGDFLAELDLAHLGVRENSDHRAVLSDSLELELDVLRSLRSLLGVLGEGLLLRLVPVLVESALDFIGQVAGPHSGEGAESIGGLHVADHADDHHGRSLKHSHSLDRLLLVQL